MWTYAMFWGCGKIGPFHAVGENIFGGQHDIPNKKVNDDFWLKNVTFRNAPYLKIYTAVLSAIAKSGKNLYVHSWVVVRKFLETCTIWLLKMIVQIYMYQCGKSCKTYWIKNKIKYQGNINPIPLCCGLTSSFCIGKNLKDRYQSVSCPCLWEGDWKCGRWGRDKVSRPGVEKGVFTVWIVHFVNW